MFLDKQRLPFTSFVREIANCNKCDLRNKAKQEIGNKWPELSNVDYYHFYSTLNYEKNIPPYMLLMQNPGMQKDSTALKKDLDEVSKHNSLQDKVEEMRKQLLKWLFEDNKTFMRKFLENLKMHSLLDEKIGEWFNDPSKRYEFFKHFHVTDLVKCRAHTSNLKRPLIEVCFKNYLQKEIVTLKPKLIFAFSSRTWIALKEWGNIEVEDNLMEAHGKVFTTKQDVSIIPLAHFSRMNLYLRNSYFHYLENGLKEYMRTRNL